MHHETWVTVEINRDGNLGLMVEEGEGVDAYADALSACLNEPGQMLMTRRHYQVLVGEEDTQPMEPIDPDEDDYHWCDWCGQYLAPPGVPCDSCEALGAKPGDFHIIGD